MKNLRQVLFFVVQIFLVFPCKAAEYSCPVVMAPSFLEGFNNVMVNQRFAFISDFKKFCRTFQRERWLNFTDKAVCFGAQDNKFATMVSPFDGFLTSIKLTHVSGQVICDVSAPQYNSRWGCSRKHPTLGKTPFNIVITTGRNNGILYPKKLVTKDKNEPLWYEKLDVNPNAPEFILGEPSDPSYVTSGQELRIWLGNGLRNSHQEEDKESICVTVKGWFLF